MDREMIERIRELAKTRDFYGLPIPQLCDLAIKNAAPHRVTGQTTGCPDEPRNPERGGAVAAPVSASPDRNAIIEECARIADSSLDAARSLAGAMYEDSRKDKYDIMYRQGWEAASEAIEEKLRDLKNPAPQQVSSPDTTSRDNSGPAAAGPTPRSDAFFLPLGYDGDECAYDFACKLEHDLSAAVEAAHDLSIQKGQLKEDLAECAGVADIEIRQRMKLERELAEAKAQLPEGMKDCTVVFKECELGHGWLTATNWVQYGCSTCELAAVRAVNIALQKEVASLFATLIPGSFN